MIPGRISVISGFEMPSRTARPQFCLDFGDFCDYEELTLDYPAADSAADDVGRFE